jgi:hypothetical protein
VGIVACRVFFMENITERIYFGARGVVNLPLGGKDRKLRYRATELAALEKRMGKGILSCLNEESLGISFLRDAIIVGVAHEFISKKGKQKETLTEDLVCRWIDDCEDKDEIAFEDLLQAVLKAVVSGLPGGAKHLEESEDSGPNAEAAA